MRFESFDLALRQYGIGLKREARARRQVVDSRTEGGRQSHATVLWIRGQTDPAAFCNSTKPLVEFWERAHVTVLHPCRVGVPDGGKRRQGAITELRVLSQNCVHKIGSGTLKALCGVDFRESNHVPQDDRNSLTGDLKDIRVRSGESRLASWRCVVNE